MTETLLGVSTGNFPSEMSLQDCVEAVRKMGADGIELNLGRKPDLAELDVSSFVSNLSGFKFITIHGPPRKQNDSENYRRVIGHVEDIREKLGAESVVFHPDWVPEPGFVEEITEPAIENLSKVRGFGRKRFREYMAGTDTKVVLDVCHAFTWSRDDLVEMYMEFGDRISHFHLSGLGDMEHEPLYMDSKVLNPEVKSVLLNNKIVLESAVGSVEEMEEEITFVREWIES